jgi:hypothetical protein
VALDELKGQVFGGAQQVRIEAGPVRVFAQALADDDPVYSGADAPVPPTFPFVMSYWGSMGQGGAAGLPIDQLRQRGLILHGEQEFEYVSWPRVGDVLEGTTRCLDVYEKEGSSGVMEFYVTETEWKNTASGEVSCRTRFTMIVRRKKDT